MNASGDTFDVNVVHQEDWFNITGVGGGSFLDGAGLGSHHNESWSYDVMGIDYDNRTVRLIWEQTGPDPSEGDERPARSPVPMEPQAPEPVEGLGDVDVSRETGLVPTPMMAGDRVLLDGQEGLAMQMDVLESSTDIADGRTFTTVRWTGSYLDLEGMAEGHLVSVGPLSGLSTTVLRSVEVPYGGSGDVAWLNETQHSTACCLRRWSPKRTTRCPASFPCPRRLVVRLLREVAALCSWLRWRTPIGTFVTLWLTLVLWALGFVHSTTGAWTGTQRSATTDGAPC